MRGGRHGSVSRPGGAAEPPADQIGQRGGHHEGLRPDAQGLPLRVGQGCRVAVELALRGVFARWRLNDATLCAGPQGVTRLACPSAGPMTRRRFRSSRPGRPGFGARQALGGAWAESLRQVRDSCGDVRATTRGPTDPRKLLAEGGGTSAERSGSITCAWLHRGCGLLRSYFQLVTHLLVRSSCLGRPPARLRLPNLRQMANVTTRSVPELLLMRPRPQVRP